ncbi:hypothetical protein [[Acholeplasma] multilocale]|uniref:hypothetical protein n=1 Tax=[Acholeplasma] multilocale TaxID=264638 RepID=UPI00047AEAB4|nr:hypothetical protein [[Acholeplasma] multilocale]
MKLKTWSFYKADDLHDVEGNILIKGEFILLILRPDILKPNRVLGFGIPAEFGTTKVIDLQNKELTHEDVNSIFGDKLGVIEIEGIEELIIKDTNLSNTPVREENIKKIIEVYNIFIKKQAIEFDTEDYSSLEKLQEQGDKFTELDLQAMPLPQLLNTVTAGLQDYYGKAAELRNPELNNDQRIQKTLNMATLQSNLILFFEQTVQKMDELIAQQQKVIKELKDELEKK